MDIQCLRCKGRGYCGRASCPHVLKAASLYRVKQFISSEDFSSSSPAPFVGRAGYPYLNVGILCPPEQREDTWLYDAPKYWCEHGYGIPQIIDFRSSLINSRFKAGVKERSKILDISREIGMASRPVELEINLEEKPRFALTADSVMAPHGPNARLKNAEITSNPKVDSKVERVVDDTDMRAGQALTYLYDRGLDENFLAKLFSIGNLGLKPDRRLVPTRWSITATDDMLAKHILSEVKDLPAISDYTAYFGSYLGNYYVILLFPEVWSYELFETYMPMASWNTTKEVNFTTDNEGFSGRKTYAENCAGGYYTVRLAVSEKLKELGRQASALVIRVITGEYSVPLGVWVTREASRAALKEQPFYFDSRELMLQYAASLARKKFGLDISRMLQQSILLNTIKTQRKLSDKF